jgi:PiT family inorganic phosphate transporter
MEALVVLSTVAIALVILFDYTNGFHDASNIVATVIASRAMTPIQAVVIGLFVPEGGVSTTRRWAG